MRFLFLITALMIAPSLNVFSQCSQTAKEVRPVFSEAAAKEYSKNLEIAAALFASDPSADNAIWYARRKGYLGRYKDAIDALTIAIGKFPNDARMYRHRGHRYITLRCFDDAIRDFEKAAKLIKGKPDEVEPDGMPNAQNTPTSTLQSNIWYHLGLASYLKGDFKKAIEAYKEGMKVSKNNDMLAAMSHWLYMAYKRSQKPVDAGRLLDAIGGDFEVIENEDYLKMLRLYRGEVKPEMLLESFGEKAETLGNASLGYGLGNWFLYNRDKVRAMSIFRKITAGNQWASFGYIAAEAELRR
ncbi:MAG: tetratricopeptide repeat protein [Pyrinomonadaceae bacterium]